jgi:hypothetical protein
MAAAMTAAVAIVLESKELSFFSEFSSSSLSWAKTG